eukprot:Em0513g2a
MHCTFILLPTQPKPYNTVTGLDQLGAKVKQLQTEQEDAVLKGDIIQLLSLCAQLAKRIDTALKAIKEQRDVSKDFEYKRYLSVFQKSFSTFQALQQATTGIEQTQLKLARAESMRRSKRISAAKEDTKLLAYPTEQQAQMFAENEIADFTRRERESFHNSSQLWYIVVTYSELADSLYYGSTVLYLPAKVHDILDMNEIFRDLATMVHEQGDQIEHIAVHVESAAVNVQQGNKQLGHAAQYKNRNRKLQICIAVIIIIVILVILIVILAVLGGLGVFSKN